MARFARSRGPTKNKIDMSLDAIIKLQKSEKKKELKAKKQTSPKKQAEQKGKLKNSSTQGKARSGASNSNWMDNTKVIPRKRKKQPKAQPVKGSVKKNTVWRNNSNQEHVMKAKVNFSNSRQQGEIRRKVNRSRRNNAKQLYSKTARENLVNTRRQIQGQNEDQRDQRTRRRKRVTRSFEERFLLAKANASKLKVVVDNPRAKPSSHQSVNVRDLIQMQLDSISAVTGNAASPRVEKPRPQRINISKGEIKFHPDPATAYPLRISVNNEFAPPPSSLTQPSLLFNMQDRITLPVKKMTLTLNERFSTTPVNTSESYDDVLQLDKHTYSGAIEID